MLEKNMALLHSGLGKDPVTKSDEFLGKFQTTIWCLFEGSKRSSF